MGARSKKQLLRVGKTWREWGIYLGTILITISTLIEECNNDALAAIISCFAFKLGFLSAELLAVSRSPDLFKCKTA
jgi:hypothetical protein